MKKQLLIFTISFLNISVSHSALLVPREGKLHLFREDGGHIKISDCGSIANTKMNYSEALRSCEESESFSVKIVKKSLGEALPATFSTPSIVNSLLNSISSTSIQSSSYSNILQQIDLKQRYSCGGQGDEYERSQNCDGTYNANIDGKLVLISRQGKKELWKSENGQYFSAILPLNSKDDYIVGRRACSDYFFPETEFIGLKWTLPTVADYKNSGVSGAQFSKALGYPLTQSDKQDLLTSTLEQAYTWRGNPLAYTEDNLGWPKGKIIQVFHGEPTSGALNGDTAKIVCVSKPH